MKTPEELTENIIARVYLFDNKEEAFDSMRELILEAIQSERDRYEIMQLKMEALNTELGMKYYRLEQNTQKLVDALENIANQDYRGNRPHECVLAYNALEEWDKK